MDWTGDVSEEMIEIAGNEDYLAIIIIVLYNIMMPIPFSWMIIYCMCITNISAIVCY